MVIIIRFTKNNIFWQIYNDKYKFLGWVGCMHGLSYISLLLFIKTDIIQENDL